MDNFESKYYEICLKNKQGEDKMMQLNRAWVAEENEYSGMAEKTVNERELSLQNQRVEFWEKHHSIPAVSELICQGLG